MASDSAPSKIDREFAGPAAGKPRLRFGAASDLGISSSSRAAMRWVSESRRPAMTSPPTGMSQCLQRRPRVEKYSAPVDIERPEHDVAAKPEPAGDAAFAFAIGRVEIGARAAIFLPSRSAGIGNRAAVP